MIENCVVKLDLENITKEIFEELIDKDWGKWGKPDKSYTNSLLFFSTDDYRVQLTYSNKQQNYTLIIYPPKDVEFSSMNEVENVLNSFRTIVIDKFNEKYKTNMQMCVDRNK